MLAVNITGGARRRDCPLKPSGPLIYPKMMTVVNPAVRGPFSSVARRDLIVAPISSPTEKLGSDWQMLTYNTVPGGVSFGSDHWRMGACDWACV